MHLLALLDPLITLLKDTHAPAPCVINAAWALTTIFAELPERTAAVVLRRDVFLRLAGLLQVSPSYI